MDTIQVNILVFGVLADKIESRELNLSIPDRSTIKTLKTHLTSKYQILHDAPPFILAVNEAYVDEDYTLKNNDVIALIPPVSGG